MSNENTHLNAVDRRVGSDISKHVRLEIQRSKDSLRTLAGRYGINIKTVARWRKRSSPESRSRGPISIGSTVLSPVDETLAVFFRRHTLLPLDDCLYGLQSVLPNLTRAALYRCFRRYGINQLPNDPAARSHPLGTLRLDICTQSSFKGDFCFFTAIDITSKMMFGAVYRRAGAEERRDFIRSVLMACPYRIIKLTIPTVSGTSPRESGDRAESGDSWPIDDICAEAGIEKIFFRTDPPWSNEQVEKMARIYDEALAHPQFVDMEKAAAHMQAFHLAYNFGRRLKVLGGRTPYEFVCKAWKETPELFIANPHLYAVRFKNGLTCMAGKRLISPR